MILIIDNYDSFVYNLARYVAELNAECIVKRNNKISLTEILELAPSHIIISPGPGSPETAGISMSLIQHFGETIPILGICLGHQAIAAVYGARVERARFPMHGKSSEIFHNGLNLFADLPNPLIVGRYHSLIVRDENFSEDLKVTARCEQQEIMGLQHRDFPVFGVQFHPESIMTPMGKKLIGNFLAF